MDKNNNSIEYKRGSVFCPHCEVDFKFDESVSDPQSIPEEGDVGVCNSCWKWWQIKDGKRIKYSPTPEEENMVNSYIEGNK